MKRNANILFWIAAVVTIGVVGWFQGYTPANQIAWDSDYNAAQARSQASGKPMLLYFTADWCGPCKQMKRTVWPDEQIESLVNTATIPVYLDTDQPGSHAAGQRYAVRAIPTIILTDHTGQILTDSQGTLLRHEGLTNVSALTRMIEHATAK